MEKHSYAIEAENLSIEYHSNNQVVHAVNGISFKLEKGKTLGLVGETGAGKSSTALALMRLLPDRVSHMKCDTLRLLGDDILSISNTEMNLRRGSIISMIFQDPMTALNPIMTVGDQILEALKIHNTDNLSARELEKKVDEALEMVGIPSARKREYPMQFSGGMKQRVVIAIALSCNPDILIADEPTTALDVTIQAQVLSLIEELKEKMNMSMIMISHDLGVIVRTCDYVGVMYAGEIIEYGTVEQLYSPGRHHPYTEGLFGAIPNIRSDARRLTAIDGMMPDPTNLPSGCSFSPRCPYCTEKCKSSKPEGKTANGHTVRCFRFSEDT